MGQIKLFLVRNDVALQGRQATRRGDFAGENFFLERRSSILPIGVHRGNRHIGRVIAGIAQFVQPRSQNGVIFIELRRR